MPLCNSNITKQNVNKLKLKFIVNTHSYITGTPLCYNNKIYIADWQGYIYCINSETGKIIYEKQLYKPPKQEQLIRHIPLISKYFGEPLPYMWNGFAGTGCIDNGIWYLPSVGGKEGNIANNGDPGRLYAIDLDTGNILWETQIGYSKYSGSLATPICDKNNVYVGLSSVEEIFSVVSKLRFKKFTPECTGGITAFDKFTGYKYWSKKTSEMDIKDSFKTKGAGIWGGIELYDNSLYTATGNSYGKPFSKVSDSVISLCSKNGDINWIFQAVENDAWLPVKRIGPDFDFGCTPTLFKSLLSINGIAVGAGNKNGYFYTIDSDSGKLIWKTFCHVNSAPDDGIRSNATYYKGNLYLWSQNKKPKDTISVCCLNSEDGKIIWNKIIEGTNSMTTGIITNELYFLANYNGELFALDTKNGDLVFKTKFTKGSIGSSLAIYNNCIYGGMGVPALYHGNPKVYGLFCFWIDNNI